MNKELLWDLATRVMTRVRCLSCVRIYRAHLDTFFMTACSLYRDSIHLTLAVPGWGADQAA